MWEECCWGAGGSSRCKGPEAGANGCISGTAKEALEAGVAAAAEWGWGAGGGAPITSSQATVRPSTVHAGVWGGEGLRANQHTCPPSPLSNTAFKKQQGEDTDVGAPPPLSSNSPHPAPTREQRAGRPVGPPPPQGSPSLAGTFRLASRLAPGPRLFGAWTDFPGCSSRRLFMKTTPPHEPPRASASVQASVLPSFFLYLFPR